MPDLDADPHDLLCDDGAEWRRRLEEPPDLTAAVERAMVRPATVPRFTVPRSWRHRAAVWGAGTAAAALVVGGALYITRDDSHPFAGAPASVTSGGHRVPYAGPVPWAAPITDPTNPRLLYVFADNDHADSDACDITVDRAIVTRQDDRRVSIKVAGYTPADHHGPECAAMAHAPVSVAVHLDAPLGTREVVDAHDGVTHRVLDATTVPNIHQLPPQCGTPALTWDPQTSIATRQYVSRAEYLCLLNMSYGPSAAMDRLDPPNGSPSTPVDIHGATATVTVMNDHLNNDKITIEWSPTEGYLVRLVIDAPSKHPISVAEAISVARSIH